MEIGAGTLTVVGLLIGIVQGLNAIVLSGVGTKIKTLCTENREDHKDIYDKISTATKEFQTIKGCDSKSLLCNHNRDEKVLLRLSLLDTANGKANTVLQERRYEQDQIDGERRTILSEKLDIIAKSQVAMVSSFELLAKSISKDKGEH
jgi:hypothetical protein